MTSWPWFLIIPVGVAAVCALLYRPFFDWLAGLSPTVPSDPDESEGHADREESGADEEFPAELRALKNAPVAPELISDTEMDLQWALIWHDCEHRWQAEVDRIFAEAQAELQRPRTFDEVRELVTA